MGNIRLRYLYRDASNYKSWGDVVFSNAECIGARTVEKALSEGFLDDGLFIARQIRLPERFLYKEYWINGDDHCFHEFYSIEDTLEPATDEFGRSIKKFVGEVAMENRRGWRVFDPLEQFKN